MAYPNTERLYDKIAKADRELADIQFDLTTLRDALDLLVKVFCEKHDADLTTARGYLDSLCEDIEFDAKGPAVRRKMAAENELAAIEDADLRRNSPVVL